MLRPAPFPPQRAPLALPAATSPVCVVVPLADADLFADFVRPMALGGIETIPAGDSGLALLLFEVHRGQASYLGLVRMVCRYNALLRAKWSFPSVYDGVLVYDETNFDDGREVYQTLPALFQKGSGDCADLVAARASERDVVAAGGAPHIALQGCRPEGGCLYHVTVKYRDGRAEDPSAALGMTA